jgi:hypothetical protein
MRHGNGEGNHRGHRGSPSRGLPFSVISVISVSSVAPLTSSRLSVRDGGAA